MCESSVTTAPLWNCVWRSSFVSSPHSPSPKPWNSGRGGAAGAAWLCSASRRSTSGSIDVDVVVDAERPDRPHADRRRRPGRRWVRSPWHGRGRGSGRARIPASRHGVAAAPGTSAGPSGRRERRPGVLGLGQAVGDDDERRPGCGRGRGGCRGPRRSRAAGRRRERGPPRDDAVGTGCRSTSSGSSAAARRRAGERAAERDHRADAVRACGGELDGVDAAEAPADQADPSAVLAAGPASSSSRPSVTRRLGPVLVPRPHPLVR